MSPKRGRAFSENDSFVPLELEKSKVLLKERFSKKRLNCIDVICIFSKSSKNENKKNIYIKPKVDNMHFKEHIQFIFLIFHFQKLAGTFDGSSSKENNTFLLLGISLTDF